MRTHGIDHHRNTRTVTLGRRARAIGQRDKRHELHERRVAAPRAAIKQVLASFSAIKTAGVRHLDTVIKDVNSDRLPTEPISVFSVDYGVRDCLAQDLLGDLQRVDTRDALNGRGATQVFGDSRDSIRNHLAQGALADCAVHKP